MPLRLRSTGGGSVCLVPPDEVTTDVLVKVPAIAGATVLTNKTPGAVLQVVHFDFATQQTFTVPSDISLSQATGLTASITPTSSTSKILVMCSANLGHVGTTSVARAFLQRTGPSTANNTLSQGTQTPTFSHVVYGVATDIMWPNTAMNWLDSPNSTSPCTYTLRIGGNGSGALVGLNRYNNYSNQWGSVSHLTLMEIAA